MPSAYQRAQDRYNYGNWNAQEKQARQQFANSEQSLETSVWNNAAATGNTRGSFNNDAYQSQFTPLKQSMDNTLGQINRDRGQYTAYVRARNAAEAAAKAARMRAQAEATKPLWGPDGVHGYYRPSQDQIDSLVNTSAQQAMINAQKGAYNTAVFNYNKYYGKYVPKLDYQK